MRVRGWRFFFLCSAAPDAFELCYAAPQVVLCSARTPSQIRSRLRFSTNIDPIQFRHCCLNGLLRRTDLLLKDLEEPRQKPFWWASVDEVSDICV